MQSTIHHFLSDDREIDVHAPAKTYYTTGNNAGGFVSRLRTFNNRKSEEKSQDSPSSRYRRASHDDKNKPRKFLIDVKETQRILVEQEDTDGDFQITVNDLGPKSFAVGTADSGGYRKIEIRGTYMLSNLLQELALADDFGRKHIVLDEARLNENPVDRLSRMIKYNFWDGLTRRIDAEGLEIICADPKNRSANHNPRIYIPYNEDGMYDYYKEAAETRSHLNLEVERLPKHITPEYVKSINDRPGILALAMEKEFDHISRKYTWRGVPFVVPGGRFNEMYGWDSYFETLGLLIDGRTELAQGMVDNFVYQIKHYGKILNANRSYYLSRSQPPFLTDMAVRVFKKLDHSTTSLKLKQLNWLANALQTAIKEYYNVWMAEPRYDKKTGLSRFRPEGLGIPPETEASHFDHVIQPFATEAKLSVSDYMQAYNDGTIKEPKLDEYFLHDRAVRESGHDTTYRYEKVCANLATIDLNSLLYKYEMDLAETIENLYDGELSFTEEVDGETTLIRHTADDWRERANIRKERINKYLWNEEKKLYFDYDTILEKQTDYESVTTFWAMWAKCASNEQAEAMTKHSLYKFEVLGGLVSGTEGSRGLTSLDRPNRQWDFPFGWAPHQIMAWQAFENYGKHAIAERIAYRWLYTITKSFVDFNGVVPEKFDIVGMTHKVQVEYGNVGVDFKYVPREGFGWMNASFQIGLSLISTKMRRALGTCTSPDLFFEKALKNTTDTPEEIARRLRRRQSAEAAARTITRNGSITAAITRIDGGVSSNMSNTHMNLMSSANNSMPFIELTEI